MAPPEALDRQYKAIVAANDRILAAQKEKMAGDYARLLRNLKSAVADAYAAYGKEGTLSYTEMQRYNRIRKLQTRLEKVTVKETAPLYARMETGLGKVTERSYTGSITAISTIANANMVPELNAAKIMQRLQKPVIG